MECTIPLPKGVQPAVVSSVYKARCGIDEMGLLYVGLVSPIQNYQQDTIDAPATYTVCPSFEPSPIDVNSWYTKTPVGERLS